MKRSNLMAAGFVGCGVLGYGVADAQNLTIGNARIVDGTGMIIERGTVVIGDGAIVSVSPNPPVANGGQVLDAGGMTLLPGFIDTHRHDLVNRIGGLTSDKEMATALDGETPGKLRLLLDEGFTTVLVPAFHADASIEVKRRLRDGELAGPRVLTVGPAFTATGDHPATTVCRDNAYCANGVSAQVDESETARSIVRDLAAAGVDAIKAVVDRQLVPGVVLGDGTLAAIIDEAHARGLPALVHALTVEDTITAARLGADRLVHTPNDALVAETSGAEVLRQRDVAIATTVSFSSPQFATTVGMNPPAGAHQTILNNIRHLWDSGVTVAFGTDSPPGIRPMVEIEQLSTVLSPLEVIEAMTRNAAMFLGLEDEIGTIEVGKHADLVLVAGDPLTDVRTLGNVKVVVQGGRIVVDER